MLLQSTICLIALSANLASAHFRIPYPGERNASNWDTQTIGPCGGDNSVVDPRFEWNPKGSPLDVNMHHKIGVGSIFYCPGNNCSTVDNFELLIWEPFDTVGAGNYCIPALTIPDEYNTVGQNGTIQVIFIGTGDQDDDYDYMYNCLDITISDDGEEWDNQCSNSTSVKFDSEMDDDLGEDTKNSTVSGYSFTAASKVSSITILDSYFASTVTQTSSSSLASSSASGSASDDSNVTLVVSQEVITTASLMDGMTMDTTLTTDVTLTKTLSSSSSATSSATVGTTVSTSATSSSSGSANALASCGLSVFLAVAVSYLL